MDDEVLIIDPAKIYNGNHNEIEAAYNQNEEDIENEADIQSHESLLQRSELRGGNIVYTCFIFLGLGTLLPWNFFITADSYWQYKFRNTSESDEDWKPRETELQTLYDPMQVCLSQSVNFGFLFINVLFSHKFSQKIRLLSSLVMMMLLFALTTIFVRVNTDEWQLGFFVFSMIIIIMISASGATFQGGLFGVASLFPDKFINAVGIGQAVGGVFASLTRILSIFLGADQVTSAFIYYLIAVVVMVLTLLEYIYVSRLTFFKYYSNGSEFQFQESEDSNKPKRRKGFGEIFKEQYEIFQVIWPYGVSLCFVFLVTLAVFPVIVVRVTSTTNGVVWAQKYFQPVCSFFLFNFFDFFGRTLAEFLLWPRRGSWILFMLSAVRIVFIPLFLLCNHNPDSIIPSVFTHDAFFIVFMIIFGFSNGYIFSLLMMYAPRMVAESEGEKVGSMMAAMIGLGLLLGSLSSFGFALIS